MSFRHSSAVAADCVNNLRGSPPITPDHRLTPCTVDLYIRPVEGSDIAEHWVLYFKWQHYDESYEANQDERGILVPLAYEGKPKETKSLKYHRKLRIADSLRVYPETVRENAKKNKFNYQKYDRLTCNCQNWIIELGKLLKLKLPDSQVTEGVDIVATAGIGALAVVGVSTLISKALNKN